MKSFVGGCAPIKIAFAAIIMGMWGVIGGRLTWVIELASSESGPES